MEANSPEVELITSRFLGHKIIVHIGPFLWFVPGVLSSCIYGTYSTVYSVQCNICAALSLFFDHHDLNSL